MKDELNVMLQDLQNMLLDNLNEPTILVEIVRDIDAIKRTLNIIDNFEA